MRLIPIAAALLLLPMAAFAHVTVWPKESTAGAHEKYEVRVPNEKQADTVAIEVRFPAGLRVIAGTTGSNRMGDHAPMANRAVG